MKFGVSGVRPVSLSLPTVQYVSLFISLFLYLPLFLDHINNSHCLSEHAQWNMYGYTPWCFWKELFQRYRGLLKSSWVPPLPPFSLLDRKDSLPDCISSAALINNCTAVWERVPKDWNVIPVMNRNKYSESHCCIHNKYHIVQARHSVHKAACIKISRTTVAADMQQTLNLWRDMMKKREKSQNDAQKTKEHIAKVRNSLLGCMCVCVFRLVFACENTRLLKPFYSSYLRASLLSVSAFITGHFIDVAQ